MPVRSDLSSSPASSQRRRVDRRRERRSKRRLLAERLEDRRLLAVDIDGFRQSDDADAVDAAYATDTQIRVSADPAFIAGSQSFGSVTGGEVGEFFDRHSESIWDGGARDPDWHNPENWSFDVVPGPRDAVIIPAGAYVELTGDADVSSVRVENGATLFVTMDGKEADRLTTLDGDVRVDGVLKYRRDVSIVGQIDVGVQGSLLGEAWAAIYAPHPIFAGNASLVVEGDLRNEGLVGLVSRNIDGTHPCCGGARAWLEVAAGYTLENDGTIHVQSPAHGLRLNDISYRLFGDVVNRGLIDLDFSVLTNEKTWINAGTIDLGTYEDNGTQRASLKIGEGVYVREKNAHLIGGGQLDLTQTDVRVQSPWLIEAGSPELFTRETTFSGTETLTLGDDGELFLYNSTVSAPFHVEGALTVRGNVVLSGGVTTGKDSVITVYASYRSVSQDPRKADASLTIVGDFVNRGDLRFYASDIAKIHPHTLGDESRLTIQNGLMVNEGLITLLEPLLDNVSYGYEIIGNLDNRGTIDLNYGLTLKSGSVVLAGNVAFNTYTDTSGVQPTFLRADDATIRYRAPGIQNAPWLDLRNQSTLHLDEPLTIDGAWKLDTDDATILGPETLTLAGVDDPDGAGYLFLWNSTVAAPLEIHGRLDVRGNNRIGGPMTVHQTGMLRLYAFRNDLYNAWPKTGDSILQVDQGFTNYGEVQLWARKGLPGWYPGHVARMTIVDGELRNEGVLSNRATETDFVPTNEIVGNVRNLGEIRFDQEPMRIVTGTLTNESVIEIPAGLELFVNQDVTQLHGSIVADGTLNLNNGNRTLRLNGGTLAGTGQVRGGVVQTAGTVSPGADGGTGSPGADGGTGRIGSLSITNNLTATGGDVLLEIAGPPVDGAGVGTSGIEFDRLSVGGTANLNEITFDVIDGYQPVVDDQYVMVTGNAVAVAGQDNATEVGLSTTLTTNQLRVDVIEDRIGETFEVDFGFEDGFEPGFGLPEINQRLTGLGMSLEAAADSLGIEPRANLQVDPDDDNVLWLNAATHIETADLLINFDSAVSAVAVTFANNTQATEPVTVSLTAYDHTGTVDIVNTPSLSAVTGTEPTTLVIRGDGIRAVQIESASDQIFVDKIQVTGQAQFDPAAVAQQFNAGITQLASFLPSWASAFDLPGVDLPLVETSVGSLFRLNDAAGPFATLSAESLATIDADVGSFEQLRDRIDAINGLSVECASGDTNCGPGDGLMVRLSRSFGESVDDASLDLAARQLLDGLNSSLEGMPELDLTSALEFDWIFGIDQQGFYLDSTSAISGSITGSFHTTGQLNSFVVDVSGSVDFAPSVSFEVPGDARIRIDQLTGTVADDLKLSTGTIASEVTADLTLPMLDFIEVDGVAENNTAGGGDPFVVRGAVAVAADLSPSEPSPTFQADWANFEIKNPDIDSDGVPDFTLDVLRDNLLELGKAVLRGQRTLFAADIATAASGVSMPLTDVPFAEAIGLRDVLADLFSQAPNGPAPPAEELTWLLETLGEGESNDVFEFLLALDDFSVFSDLLNDGLPETPIDLARFRVNLDQIPLRFLEDGLSFDLDQILPETLASGTRVGLDHATLGGQIVFGFDTGTNPLYLVTSGAAGEPAALEGGFELSIDVNGEPLAGLLTLEDAEAVIAPVFSFEFVGGDGRLRLAPDLSVLEQIQFGIDDHDRVAIAADRGVLQAGPLSVAAFDDDSEVSPRGIEGAFDIENGTAELAVRRFESTLAGGITVRGENGTLAFGPGLPTGTPLLAADVVSLSVTFPGPSQLDLTAHDFEILPDGTASVRRAEAVFDAQSSTQMIGGILPFRVERVEVSAVDRDGDGTDDPLDLNDLQADVKVRGFFDETMLADLPFTPTIKIGDLPQGTGPANPFEITYRLTGQSLRPWDLGPITLGFDDIDVEGLTLRGEVGLGGYRLGGWVPSLSGFFEVADDAGTPEAFRGLRIEIVPESSRLTVGDDLLSEGGRLRLRAEASLSDEFAGSLAGVSLAGATLSFDVSVEATPTGGNPPLAYDATFSVGTIGIGEIEIEIQNLATVVARDISLDLDPQPGSRIGRIGRVDIRPNDNSLLAGLETIDVELFDAELFADRIELGDVRASMNGVLLHSDMATGARTDLLLVDDLELRFQEVQIPGTFDAANLSQTVAAPADVRGIGFTVDAAVLLPTSSDPIDVPDIGCDDDGQTVGAISDLYPGVGFVTCLVGEFDSATGESVLTADLLTAQLLGGLRLFGERPTLRLRSEGQPDDLLLGLAEGSLTVPVVSGSEITLDVSELEVTRGGEISILEAELEASSGVLSTIGFGGLLPLDVTRVRIAAGDANGDGIPDDRTTLNRDANGDGIPDADFDVSVTGAFDFSPLEALGLSVNVSVGETPRPEGNAFDTTFRVIDGKIRPWTTGPIAISAAADSEVGLNFDGTFVSAGYTAGVWDPAIEGTMTGSIELDGGQSLSSSDLVFEILPGSRLDFDDDEGHLYVDGRIRFAETATGTIGGVSITDGEFGFRIWADASFGPRAPFIELTRFDVELGELSIDEITVDVENLATLTLQDILLDPGTISDPNPLLDEPIGRIGTIRVDVTNNAAFRDLSVGQVEVIDAVLYRDRIELNDVRATMDGVVTDGNLVDPLDVLLVDDLRLLFDDVTIFGAFDPTNLPRTVNVDGTVDGIEFEIDAAILLPDSAASYADLHAIRDSEAYMINGLAAVFDVQGSYDGDTGELLLEAGRLAARPLDGLTMTATGAALAINSDQRPLVTVDRSQLDLSLVDSRTVRLDVLGLRIEQDGELSILEAVLEGNQGVATSLGLGGLLPFDVTGIRIAFDPDDDGTPDAATVLNRDAEFDLRVEGFFDFGPLEAVGLTPTVTIGGDPQTEQNRFRTSFRMRDGAAMPWDVGPITIGLRGGPYAGLSFDGEFTSGGYVDGVWQPSITGSMTGTLATDGGGDSLSSELGELTFEILPGSRLDFGDDDAALIVEGKIHFESGVGGSYAGVTLDGAELDFDLFVGAELSRQTPFVRVTDVDVLIGQLSIDELSVDVANLATLTLKDILVDPNAVVDPSPVGNERIGSVRTITLDATEHPVLSQLSIGEVQVLDAVIYRDRIELGDVRFLMGGVVTDGDPVDPLRLLYVEELRLLFEDVVISGTFDPSNLGGSVDVTSTLDGVTFELDAGILLPDPAASLSEIVDPCAAGEVGVAGLGAVCDVRGFYDGATGELNFDADRAVARPLDGVRLDLGDLRLTLNPENDGDPLAMANLAQLSLALVDRQQAVTLDVHEVEVSQGGALSILEAEMVVDQGTLTTLGLAGILPFDVTGLRIAAPDADQNGVPDSRTVLRSDGISDFDLAVNGYFDFSIFEPLGLTPTVTIGGEARGEGRSNTFETLFRFEDGAFRPWDVGPIELGLAGSPIEGVTIDGSLTLAGYVAGEWQSDVTGSFTGTLEATQSDGSVADLAITLTVNEGTLDLENADLVISGDVALEAGASGTFGGWELSGASIDFSMLLDAQTRPLHPHVTIKEFAFGIGNEITIDRFDVNVADIFEISAAGITYYTAPRSTGEIGEITDLQITLPAASALSGLTPTITGQDVRLYADRIEFASLTLELDGTFAAGGTDLLAVDDLLVTFTNVEFVVGDLSQLTQGELVSLPDFQLSTGTITVTLDEATLLPGSTSVAGSVFGLEGFFDLDDQNEIPDGTLVFEIDRASASIFDGVFQAEVAPPAGLPDEPAARIHIGPSVSDQPLLQVGTAILGLQLFDDKSIELTANDLHIGRDGEISILSASIGTKTVAGQPPVGIGEALGLAAGLLPLDVSYIEISGDDRISLNVADPSGSLRSIDDINIEVQGYFDFTLFESLPFTPVISIGNPDDPANPFEATDSTETFDVSFRMEDLAEAQPKIRIRDIGPITLGIRDFELGPLTIDATTITLGGFVDGQWQSNIGLDFGMSWAGDNVDFESAATLDAGTSFLYGAESVGNPNPGSTTIVLDAAVGASLASGNLQLNPMTGELESRSESSESWGFGFEQLGLDFGVQFSIRFDEAIGYSIEPVSDQPYLVLDGLAADAVAFDLGGLLRMSADGVDFDFGAFASDGLGGIIGGPFLTFDSLTVGVGDVDRGDHNPLAGLAGTAGNFAIGWDPDAVSQNPPRIPFELYQLPDAFVSLSLPSNGGFGFPDWLPLSIREIGLRFPDTFSDLLPPSEPPDDEGDQPPVIPDDLPKFSLDALTNFEILFSGGVVGTEDAWPITFEVENATVNVDLLYEYAKEIARVVIDDLQLSNGLRPSQMMVGDPDVVGGEISLQALVDRDGPLAGIRALGPQLLTLFPDLVQEIAGFGTFPINLSAINVGVEPFSIGPVMVGGGLGFGTVKVDTDGDGSKDTDVLFGRIEGQLAYAKIGVGIELVVTQYGPVMARLFAGVPIPIGTLVGALAGSVIPGLGTAVGAGIGTQSGFIITGLQGGFVFDGEPLPMVNEAAEILGTDFGSPLDVGSIDEIIAATEALFWEPDGEGGVHVFDERRQPWSEGFKLAVSGTLTNIHVHGMIGAEVTLGANIGFGDLLTGDAPATAPGSDPGFQLYGLGELQIMGLGPLSGGLANAGILFDFSDPLNPVLNMAAGAPVEGNLLSMLFPVDIVIGARLETEGIVAGSIAAIQLFVEEVRSGAITAFDDELSAIAALLDSERDRVLSQAILDVDLNGVVDANEEIGMIDLDYLKTRLGQIFSLDLEDLEDPEALAGESLSDALNRAALTAGELMQALVVQAGPEFAEQLVNVVIDAGDAAAETFFNIINPSLTLNGHVQPALLGMPIGEPTEKIDVRVEKKRVHFDGRFRVLEKLMAISPIPLPLSDEINVSVDVPFDNLFRDLALNRVPVIDVSGDWRATFQGTLKLFNLFDLGDVAGIMFPSIDTGVALTPEEDADGNGIPDDHPLDTHVRFVTAMPDLTDEAGNPIEDVNFGTEIEPQLFNRVVALESDRETLMRNGGVLLDARLTVPGFVSDPFAWFQDLRSQLEDVITEEGGELIPACQGVSNPQSAFDCFMANPAGFLGFAASLPDQILSEQQLAQVQLFVPNFLGELSDLLDVSDPVGTIEVLRRALIGVPDFADPANSIPPDPDALLDLIDEATRQDILELLAGETYFRGQVGNVPDGSLPTTGTILGIDLGGALIQYADPDPNDGIDERSLFAVADFDGLTANIEFAGLDSLFDSSTPPAFPAVGATIAVGSKADDDTPVVADQVRQLLASVPFEMPIGDWVFPAEDVSPLESTSGALLRAFTPGFNPEASAPSIERFGGVAFEASVGLSSPLGSFQGDLEFELGADVESPLGWSANGSFSGYGNLTLGGLANVPLGGEDDPLLSGAVTEEGLMILDVGADLPADLLGPGVGFAAGAQATLLVNLSDQSLTYDAPHLDATDDPQVSAFGMVLLVDGDLTVDEFSVAGTFQIVAEGNRFSISGSGAIDAGPFDLLLGLSSIEMTTVGAFEKVDGGTGAIGGFLFEATASSAPAGSDFFDAAARFNLAFNTSPSPRTIDLGGFLGSGDSVIGLPDELEGLLTVPKETTRLLAQGDYRVLGFGFEDTTFVMQASSTALDVGVAGTLDLGRFGSVQASNAFHMNAGGAAGRFTLDGGLSLPNPGLSGDLLTIGGNLAFEFNTTDATVDVQLPGFADFSIDPTLARVRAGTPSTPASVTLFEAVELDGEVDILLQPNGLSIDASLGLSVDVPSGVPYLPPSIDVADADVELDIDDNGLQRARFGFSLADQPSLVSASLFRSGCFLVDLPLVIPALDPRFNVLTGAATCISRVYLDDVEKLETNTNINVDVPIVIEPPSPTSFDLFVTYVEGTALRGTDFTGNNKVTVPAGVSQWKLPVTILPTPGDTGTRVFTVNVDDIVERDHNGITDVIAGANPEQAVVTIYDDEAPPSGPPITITIEPTGNLNLASSIGTALAATIGENQGSAKLRIRAPQLLDGDSLTLHYDVLPSGLHPTFTADLGTDFGLGVRNGVINIAGNGPIELSLPILNDAVLEYPETFVLAFTVADAAQYAESTTLLKDRIEITINNDDPLRPADAVVFYSFDNPPGPIPDCSGDTCPEYARTGLIPSAVSHSAGLFDVSGGMPQLDPTRPPADETSAITTSSWSDGGLGANLVRNGGGELGSSFWVHDGRAWRGASASGPTAIEGENYFRGPVGRTDATLSQTVDVSSMASTIDSGRQAVEASAQIHVGSVTDSGRVELLFFDAKQRQLGPAVTSPTHSSSEWDLVSVSPTLPVGTRSILVRLVASDSVRRQFNPRLDVSFDDVRIRPVLPESYRFTLEIDDDPDRELLTRADYLNAPVVTVTGIDFWDRSSGSSEIVWELRSSHDGFANALASGTTHPGEFGHQHRVLFDEPLFGLRPILEPLEFRLYAYADDGTSWTVDNLAVLGSIGSLADVPLPPVANDDVRDVFNLGSNGVSISGILDNDFDPNGDAIEVVEITRQPEAGRGTVVRSGERSFRYFGPDGFTGQATFEYMVRNVPPPNAPSHLRDVETATATVTLNVVGALRANQDSYVAVAGQPLVIDAAQGFLANDRLEAFDAGTAQILVTLLDPSEGTINVNNDGSFVFNPPAGVSSGLAQFRYVITASGPYGTSVDDTDVYITIVPDANRQANHDTFEVDEDTLLVPSVSVLQNDSPGLTGPPLQAFLVSGPRHGELVTPLQEDGTFVYRPNANFNGQDRFVYRIGSGLANPRATVTINVQPVNDPPNAIGFTVSGPAGSTEQLVIDPVARILAANPGFLIDVETPNSQINARPAPNQTWRAGYDGQGLLFYDPPPSGLAPTSFDYLLRDRGEPTGTNVQESQPATIDIVTFEQISVGVIPTGTTENPAQQTYGQSYAMMGYNGYLDQARAFLDVNGNLVRDEVELTDPETGEVTMVLEPEVQTAANGSFLIDAPFIFDRNGDGRIGADEGSVVIPEGLVTGTGLPLAVPLIAPAGASVVNPLTSLLWSAANGLGVDYPAAQQALRASLSIPRSIDLLQFHALNATAAGDPLGPLVYGRTLEVQNTVASLVTTWEATDTIGRDPAFRAVIEDLTRRSLRGESLELTDPELVRDILRATGLRLGQTLDEPSAAAIAELIAAGNEMLRLEPGTTGIEALTRFSKVERVVHRDLADVISGIVRGEVDLGQAMEQNTGSALETKVSSAEVFNVVPSSVYVSDEEVHRSDGADAVTFQVRLTRPSAFPVSLSFRTKDESAIAGVDYESTAGVISFEPGETEKTVEVPVLFDSGNESVKGFMLELFDAEGAVFLDSIARAEIVGGDDGDSVETGIESLLPGGDGNGDGVADALQSNVVTTPVAGGAHFLTFAADASVTLDTFEEVPIVDGDLTLPPGVTASLDAYRMEIPVDGPSTRLSVTLNSLNPEMLASAYVPLEINDWYAWTPDPTSGEASLQSLPFDGNSGVIAVDVDNDGFGERFEIELVDGGWGDQDGVVNGRIVFQGLPVFDAASFATPLDSDGDGVPDAVEASARNGGDGNGDGIPDWLQANVASLPTEIAGSTLTLVAPSNVSLSVPVANPVFDDRSLELENQVFPFGQFDFSISGADPGQSVEIEWRFDGTKEFTSLHQKMMAPDAVDEFFGELSRSQDGESGIQSLSRERIVTRHVDGGRGDSDGEVDGAIRVVAGPTLASGVPARNPVRPSDVNNDGRTTAIDALLVINALWWRGGADETPPASSTLYLDVNGDGRVTALDALLVINDFFRRRVGGPPALSAEAEAEDEKPLDEKPRSYFDFPDRKIRS